MKESTKMIVECIRSIPAGKVASYGAVALMSGYPTGCAGARQVARMLSSLSDSCNLPWWRIVKADGSIAFGPGEGRDLQKKLLLAEGVEFSAADRVDMARFGVDAAQRTR